MMKRGLPLLLCFLAVVAGCHNRPDAPANMVLVDSGRVVLGGSSGPAGRNSENGIPVKAFFIDTYEATNSRYDSCVERGGCTLRKTVLPSWFARPDQPAVNVTFDQAWALCRFEGKRLPTEIQWERAATSEKRAGVELTGNNLASKAPEGFRFTFRVGAMTRDATASGLRDMAGNASEWVAQSDPGSGDGPVEHRVARGGNFLSTPDRPGIYERRVFPEVNFTALWLGFRCIKDAQ